MKRHRRRFRFMIDQEPRSKNITASEAISFQRALKDQLLKRSQSAYSGRILLYLDFHMSSKTPPSIYKLAKNYLDLMQSPRKDSGLNGKYLLYRDDRQVRALIVRYHLPAFETKGRIHVTAEPFRDFQEDIELVHRIRINQFEEDRFDRTARRESREGPFQEDNRHSDFESDQLREFESEKEVWVSKLGAEGFEALRRTMRHSAQQHLLHDTDMFMCGTMLEHFRSIKGTNGIIQIAEAIRAMTMRPPFVLDLHHSPTKHGDGVVFGNQLRRALQEYKAKHRSLFPLATMINVTVLYVPPRGGGKDLDNLAQLIIPAVHEIWAPPSNLMYALEPQGFNDKDSIEWLEKLKRSIPKEPKFSINELRVFELTRFPNDPEEGFVRLAIGDGYDSVDFRGRIDDYLDQWGESF